MAQFRIRPIAWDDVSTILALEAELYPLTERLDDDYVRICCGHFCDSSFLILRDGRPCGYLLSFLSQKGAFCTRLTVSSKVSDHRQQAFSELLFRFRELLVERGIIECAFTTRVATRPLLDPGVELPDELGDFRVVARIAVRAFDQLLRSLSFVAETTSRLPGSIAHAAFADSPVAANDLVTTETQ